jgi:hypothetical protein
MTSKEKKQEQRVLAFFVVLAAVIVLLLARGLYLGEIKFGWNKGCATEDCVQGDPN